MKREFPNIGIQMILRLRDINPNSETQVTKAKNGTSKARITSASVQQLTISIQYKTCPPLRRQHSVSAVASGQKKLRWRKTISLDLCMLKRPMALNMMTQLYSILVMSR